LVFREPEAHRVLVALTVDLVLQVIREHRDSKALRVYKETQDQLVPRVVPDLKDNQDHQEH